LFIVRQPPQNHYAITPRHATTTPTYTCRRRHAHVTSPQHTTIITDYVNIANILPLLI
jgi:hypothetical protein